MGEGASLPYPDLRRAPLSPQRASRGKLGWKACVRTGIGKATTSLVAFVVKGRLSGEGMKSFKL
eukprot:8377385-Alexandrium_andersonii.AAC.1